MTQPAKVFNFNPQERKLGAELHKTAAYEESPHHALIDFVTPFLDSVTIAPGRVLVATYRRPEKTAGGIIMVEKNLDEDKWQGVAALVLKLGAGCFEDDANITFRGFKAHPLDWVTFRPTYGVSREFRGLHCRIVEDKFIDAVIEDPSLVW